MEANKATHTAKHTLAEKAFPARSPNNRSLKPCECNISVSKYKPCRESFSVPVNNLARDIDHIRPFGHKHGHTPHAMGVRPKLWKISMNISDVPCKAPFFLQHMGDTSDNILFACCQMCEEFRFDVVSFRNTPHGLDSSMSFRPFQPLT